MSHFWHFENKDSFPATFLCKKQKNTLAPSDFSSSACSLVSVASSFRFRPARVTVTKSSPKACSESSKNSTFVHPRYHLAQRQLLSHFTGATAPVQGFHLDPFFFLRLMFVKKPRVRLLVSINPSNPKINNNNSPTFTHNSRSNCPTFFSATRNSVSCHSSESSDR